MKNFDAIIPLGGGRNRDGNLTPMSCERLDKAVDLYLAGEAALIFALGGLKSTYRPNAIEFGETGGHVRRRYLLEKGIPEQAILALTTGCQDTIGEVLAVREHVEQTDLKKFLVVTSELHLPRSLFIFRRIMGIDFEIQGESVPSTGVLVAKEEGEYLNLVRSYFAKLPKRIQERNFDEWYKAHPDYYVQHLAIHDKYHSNGRDSQAYLAVKD